MAKLTIDKQSYISTTSNFVSIEEYKAGLASIQKRIDRIKRVQKAKNWKHNLTK
jgi:hypothetical protein